MQITKTILDLLLESGARFLKKCPIQQYWYVAKAKVGRDKIGHFLRRHSCSEDRSTIQFLRSQQYPPIQISTSANCLSPVPSFIPQPASSSSRILTNGLLTPLSVVRISSTHNHHSASSLTLVRHIDEGQVPSNVAICAKKPQDSILQSASTDKICQQALRKRCSLLLPLRPLSSKRSNNTDLVTNMTMQLSSQCVLQHSLASLNCKRAKEDTTGSGYIVEDSQLRTSTDLALLICDNTLPKARQTPSSSGKMNPAEFIRKVPSSTTATVTNDGTENSSEYARMLNDLDSELLALLRSADC